MSANRKAAHGKILQLLREIHLTSPLGWGKPIQDLLPKGWSVIQTIQNATPFWFSERVPRIVNELIEILYGVTYPEAERKAAGDIIIKTIINLATESRSRLFDRSLVAFGRAGTLFAAKGVADHADRATAMCDAILQSMQASRTRWMTVYPLERVISKSFRLTGSDLAILNTKDTKMWESFCEKCSSAKMWSKWTLGDAPVSPTESPFGQSRATTWIVSWDHGTADGAREIAARKIRMFGATLLAHAFASANTPLGESSAHRMSYSAQFPEDAEPVQERQFTGASFVERERWRPMQSGVLMASIGEVFPSLLEELFVEQDLLQSVDVWYSRINALPEQDRTRIDVGCVFAGHGLVSKEFVRFVTFFIVLDALFGRRRSVEQAITDGVRRTFPRDAKWVQRVRLLYALRSELVHGAIHTINDWSHLKKYRKAFNSEPLRDLEYLVMHCLVSSPVTVISEPEAKTVWAKAHESIAQYLRRWRSNA